MILVFMALLVSSTGFAQSYDYTARTENPILQAGQVTAASLTWSCSGNVCRISGPWSQPGVSACAQLATFVGRITEYGHPARSASALAQHGANEIGPGRARLDTEQQTDPQQAQTEYDQGCGMQGPAGYEIIGHNGQKQYDL